MLPTAIPVWLSRLHMLTTSSFCQNLENSEKSYFLKSSSMKSRGVIYHPWLSLMSPQVSKHVLVHFHKHWFSLFLGDFFCSQVRRVLRTPSHPQDECPTFAAGGKPSTGLPPGELVEQLWSSKRAEPTKDNARHNIKKHKKIHWANHASLGTWEMQLQHCNSNVMWYGPWTWRIAFVYARS